LCDEGRQEGIVFLCDSFMTITIIKSDDNISKNCLIDDA